MSTRRPPRRHRIAVGSIALILAAWPTTSLAGVDTQRSTQSSSGARLELIDQRFATDPNGDIQLRYLLTGLVGDPLQLVPRPAPPLTPGSPATDPAAPVDSATVEPVPEPPVPELPTLTIEVTNYLPLSDPDDVAALVGSDVDPSAFRSVGDAVDGVAFDARPLLSRNDDGTVELALDIGTDVVDSIETRLKMERPGIYPLRIQLLIGDRADRNVVATAGTMIQRLAGAGDTDVEVAPPIDLSIVTVTPAPGPGADEATNERARTRLDESVDLAAELDPPVTLEVPPLLVADAAATPEGAEHLANSLADDELVALPLIPLDVSSAVAADRADAYTRLVAAGEDVLTEAVPTTPSRREVWITTDELSAGGAQHLRDLGTRFVIIPAELYADTISNDAPPTDRFVEAALPDGGTLPFLVVDALAEQLTESAADQILARSTSVEWGVETLAEMLVEQADEDAAAGSASGRPAAPPRRSRILTTPDLASPDPRLLQALAELTTTTPSVRFTPASALTGVTDVALVDGEPVSIELPEVAGQSLDSRIELLDRTALRLASAASMLPPDDPRPADWSDELESLISTGYSDDRGPSGHGHTRGRG